MGNRYRVVNDCWCGYEVQIKRWFLPFWYQCGGGGKNTNTHTSIEGAKDFAKKHKSKFVEYIDFD